MSKRILATLCLAALLWVPGSECVQAADAPFLQTLTSAQRNIRVESWEMTSRQVAPDCPINWSVRKHVLHGGKQEGVDVILIDNGRMQIAICPTRGMGVLWATVGDVRLGWNSPVREIVHPQYVNLQSRGGLGWLEGFNEFICRCGLEWSGHPGTDKFVNNVGDEATMDLTLHGKVANIPASEVEVIAERTPPFRIRVRGRVDERMFYGPKLELWTELSTDPGSASFRIADTLVNHGAAAQEFQILYHVNFGPPLLGKGARFVGAAERVTPFNAHAAKGIAEYTSYVEPTDNFIEQVYKIRPVADKKGRSMGMLVNGKGDRAASLEFNVSELPFLTLWKNTNSEPEGYVTGIEPGTGFPHNRAIERKLGRVPKLAAGESRAFALDIAVHLSEAEVKAAAERVATIQGDRRTQLDRDPEKID